VGFQGSVSAKRSKVAGKPAEAKKAVLHSLEAFMSQTEEEKQALASEIAELKLQKEALASENEKLKRELTEEKARAATALEFSKAASTAVKVKKEQNAQMNRQVQELNEMVEEANQCSVCMERACNRILTACGHTYCQVCIDLIASSAAAQRTCPTCRKEFTQEHIGPFFG